jgi:hypothetical protein
MLGPSIQLPSSLEAVPDECFAKCKSLAVIAFGPNPRVREIHTYAFRGCPLKSFCIPASVVVITWFCFCDCHQLTEVTFESPSKVEQISHFDPGAVTALSFPDSVISLAVHCASENRLICSFGQDSKLQHFGPLYFPFRGAGFMRLGRHH